MDIIGAKVLSGCLFFLVAACFIFLPFWSVRWYVRKRGTNVALHSAGQQIVLVQCLYSLASGVLMGTCLVHLLPESLETFREAVRSRETHNGSQSSRLNTVNVTDSVSSQEDATSEDYPWPELLVALGFMAVYMLDNGLQSCCKHERATDYTDRAIEDEDVAFLGTDESSYTAAGDDYVHKTGRHSHMSRSVAPYGPVEQTEADAGDDNDSTESNCLDTHWHNGPNESVPCVKIARADPPVLTASSPRTGHTAQTWTASNSLRSAALVAALCVHGFFDGVMVGLQTSVSVVVSLAFAISLHKSFVCVALSLSLLRKGDTHASTMSACLCGLLFAVASPLGLLVSGVFLHAVFEETVSGGVSMTPACLQTFAVGTFLYVALLEVIDRQQSKTVCVDILKQVFLCLGFAFMATLRAAVGHS